jgi:hypothetical protein
LLLGGRLASVALASVALAAVALASVALAALAALAWVTLAANTIPPRTRKKTRYTTRKKKAASMTSPPEKQIRVGDYVNGVLKPPRSSALQDHRYETVLHRRKNAPGDLSGTVRRKIPARCGVCALAIAWTLCLTSPPEHFAGIAV